MKHQQDAVLDALLRSQRFLEEHAGSLTGVVDLAAARKRLDDVVASFTAHALDQDVGSRGAKGETAKQRQLRTKLRKQQMEPVAVIARRNLRTTPEFAALRMPKRSVVGQAFLASARGMADAATIHRDILVAQGLPSTFLDGFKGAIAKFETSLKDREKSRTRRIGATKGLDVEEKQGRTVLSVLDALAQQALADNQALLQAWQSARLIRRKAGTSAAPAVLTTTTGGLTGVVAPTATEGEASAAIPLRASDTTSVAAA
jgi:hypothetical protein